MSIVARELFDLARQTELKIAVLYEDFSKRLPAGSEAAKFFAKMGAQEHMHASWVDEMMAEVNPNQPFAELEAADFEEILITIDDVHDEVITREVPVAGALEIIIHLENSTAEEFYKNFPPEIPGLPHGKIERMIRSCQDHVKALNDFLQHCRETGQAGVHSTD